MSGTYQRTSWALVWAPVWACNSLDRAHTPGTCCRNFGRGRRSKRKTQSPFRMGPPLGRVLARAKHRNSLGKAHNPGTCCRTSDRGKRSRRKSQGPPRMGPPHFPPLPRPGSATQPVAAALSRLWPACREGNWLHTLRSCLVRHCSGKPKPSLQPTW